MAGFFVPATAFCADAYPEFDIGAQLDDSSPRVPTENNYDHLRMTPQRALHSNLRNQAGTEIGTSSNPVRTDTTGTTTQPISATDLPLPSGASTSSLQTTGNSSLSSIDGKLNSLGQKTMSASVPVTMASDQLLDSTIHGGTNGTTIGNTNDRLKVDAQFTSITTTVPSWSKNLRYMDMNASSGGIARGTSIATSATWTTIYSYSGSGFIAGLLINVETFTGWEFKLLVDGETIFDFLDSDLSGDTIYDVDDIGDFNQATLGISKGSHDRFIFHSPLSSPIYYTSSVTVQIRRPTAGAKKFQAGLMIMSKET